jgi:hypothetical protein
MKYHFDKDCNPSLLYQEILSAYPFLEREVSLGGEMERVSECAFRFPGPGIEIIVPDTVPAEGLSAIVERHDPKALTAEQSRVLTEAQAEKDDLLSLAGKMLVDLTPDETRTLLRMLARELGILKTDGSICAPEERRRNALARVG